MIKEEIQYKTDVLLATIRWIDANRKQYIDWAIKLLLAGVENENLYILAGLDENDWSSIEQYFIAATKDLDLKTNQTSEELFHIATSIIAQEVIDGKTQPRKGLALLEKISRYASVDGYLIDSLYQFEELAEDLSLLGEYNQFYSGLTLENINEVIIDEMKMFLIAQSKGWKNITNLIYCDKCNNLSLSEHKIVGWFRKRYKWYCKKCHSKNFLDWYKINDRKQILEKLGIVTH